MIEQEEDIYTKIVNDIDNQDFINSLAPIAEAGLHNEPAAEVWKIMQTFQKTIDTNGPDSFTQMLIVLNDEFEPLIVLEPRPYTTKNDMYASFIEMAFAYSSYQAHSFIFVSDVSITEIASEVKKEALTISFVSRNSAGGVNLPYQIIDNVLVWNNKDFISFGLEGSSNNQVVGSGYITEMLYIMSHITHPVFPPNSLINYYNFRDFPMLINQETNIVQQIKIDI